MGERLSLTVGTKFRFVAEMEEERAPKTCAAFRALLPYREKLVHCRWSGEGCWIPLGDLDIGIGPENETSRPAPGMILWYPGGVSETELIFAYGEVVFASKFGQLAGNHFLTVVEGAEQLAEMGRSVLYEGAHEVVLQRLPDV